MAFASSQLQERTNVTTIAGATIACRKGLEQCITITVFKYQEWAENRLADFNVWDSDLAASSDGQASLENRLFLKPQLRTAVLTVLLLYKQSIDLCIDLGTISAIFVLY